jgi:serine/threonine protein kinase
VRSMGRKIGDVFVWASGADPALLTQTAERRWYHSLGASVFLTATLAGFSVVLLVRSSFPGVAGWQLIALATFWTLLVFNVDRIIVSRVLLEPSRLSKMGLFTARFALALVVSVAISEGLVLAILAPEVRQQVDLTTIQQQKAVVAAQSATDAAARARFQPELNAIDTEVNGLRNTLMSAAAAVTTADAELKCESTPTPDCKTGSGNAGPGDLTEPAKTALTKARNELNTAQSALDYYTTTLVPVSFTADQLATCGRPANTTQLTAEQNARCLVELKIAAATVTAAPADQTTDGILRRIVALTSLGRGEDGTTVWVVRIVFFLLLSLIDLIPLSSKLFGGNTAHDVAVRSAFQRRTTHFLDNDLPREAKNAAKLERSRYYDGLFEAQVDDAHENEEKARAEADAPPPTANARRPESADVGQEASVPPHPATRDSHGKTDDIKPLVPEARDLHPPRRQPLQAGQYLRPASSSTKSFQLERKLTLVDDGALSGAYQLWVARDSTGQQVVLKVCDAMSANDPSVDGLKADIRAAALNHPNVINTSSNVYVDSDTDAWFITMDYYPNGDLHRWAGLNPKAPLSEVLRIVEGVMSGLAKAHSKDILHLDIKPRNVLMNYSDPSRPVPVITDFGISKLLHILNSEPTDGLIGTIVYAPLEQIFPHQKWGARCQASDLWAVAALLFELVTGQKPRHYAEVAARMEDADRRSREYLDWLRRTQPVPPRLDTLVQGLPVTLVDMVERWLSNDSGQRTSANPRSSDVMPEALSELRAVIGLLR